MTPKVRDPSLDTSDIQNAVQDYIDYLDNDKEYHEDGVSDYEHEIFEKVIEWSLGSDAWEWINNRRE